jgi:ATP-dependent Clp protease ATP-binding subunit ClpA
MFERFTDRARRVVVVSQEESRLLGHDYIGTEHIFLALVRIDDGFAGRALASAGVELDAARAVVTSIVGRGDAEPTASHIPFTPRAKKVLELSLREALAFGHKYIGTEHVLLGLIREGEGVGCQALVALGVDLPALDATVKRMIGAQSPPGSAASVTPPRSLLRRIGFARRGTGSRERVGEELLPVLRRFTLDARQALDRADSEAQRLQRAYVGEEHVLLGILAAGEGRGARALAAAGVTLDGARERVEGLAGRGEERRSAAAIGPVLVPSGLDVVEMSLVEAVAAGREDIDSGDLLLGFVRRAEKPEGLAAPVLSELGTSPRALREAVRAAQEEGGEGGDEG